MFVPKTDPAGGNPTQVLAFRAIQGHSSVATIPQNIGWRTLSTAELPRAYHGTRYANMISLMNKGLIPGGLQTRGGRTEVFFSPSDPRGNANPCFPIYPFECEIVVEIDTAAAERVNGCKFHYTEGGAVLCQEVVPSSSFI